MHILMLSSSRAHGSDYLAPNQDLITAHLAGKQQVLFVPFAGVSVSYDDYTAKVQAALPGYQITGIHACADPIAAVSQAEAILVGGGNTFHLLYQLYQQALLAPIQAAVKSGTPYIGWSAGSNICGATIRTTNDMPIIEPPSFNALGFVPFQLNPHYTDAHPKDFHGETRDERLMEFSLLHPQIPIVGIREGSALIRHHDQLMLADVEDGVMFKEAHKHTLAKGSDLCFLL
jgi:dipeptidase E